MAGETPTGNEGEKTLEMRVADLEDKLNRIVLSDEEVAMLEKIELVVCRLCIRCVRCGRCGSCSKCSCQPPCVAVGGDPTWEDWGYFGR